MDYKNNFSSLKYLSGREIGHQFPQGTTDKLYSSLYNLFSTFQRTERTPHAGQDWGAVFGFGFSPDGKLLAAACENKCMLLYDSSNARLISRRFNVHDNCVNCVRFLDNRLLATCSDDKTVRLWDFRFLSRPFRVLRGHTSWVKNIEYAASTDRLITSGFDGNIFSWDINNSSEKEKPVPILCIDGTLRTNLTPDENTLIVSTLNGYFILIHDLDLDHLSSDMNGFRPEVYRLLQLLEPLGQAISPSCSNNVFKRKRNRVEFMAHFPDDNNAESISTMQIHPHGWCVASRNTSMNEDSEWTCVHDIQPHKTVPAQEFSTRADDLADTESDLIESWLYYRRSQLFRRSSQARHRRHRARSDRLRVEEEPASVTEENSVIELTNLETVASQDCDRHEQNSDFVVANQRDSKRSSSVSSDSLSVESRLLYYIEEANVGRGFIKEQSFSSNGRVIASPFGNEVRLLSFSEKCSEICDDIPTSPRPLHEVGTCALQKSNILASTFSPVQCLLVAGAYDGSIAFSQPVL